MESHEKSWNLNFQKEYEPCYVPSGHRATPMIFPEPLPFRHDYGCVGLRDKGSISVVHVMLMTLYCVAPEVMLLKRN